MKSLQFKPLNENLFVKVIRIEEKRECISNIRVLIEDIKSRNDATFEQSWKLLVEGALSEGKFGNIEEARNLFNYIISNYKTNGAVYVEASKFEEREDNIEEAVDYCDQGLAQNPKYGPLWFQYLKLYEKSSDIVKMKKFD